MNYRATKRGFSITEVLVVVAIVALLVGLGVAAAKQIRNSLESSTGVKSLIGAALSNARATALKEQKYTGVRFQQNSEGRQYMTLVVYDDQIGEMLPGNIGLRAVTGRKPNPLPVNVGVMDMYVKADYDGDVMTSINNVMANEKLIAVDADINSGIHLLDATTFTILFAPSGKLVTHSLRVSRTTIAGGDIFNSSGGMFVEDDKNISDGYQIEMSRKAFVIFAKDEFDKTAVDKRWSSYLVNLDVLYINPYSGEVLR